MTIVAVLALFEVLPRVGLLPRLHFPPVTKTFAALGEQVVQLDFWWAILDTVQGWALGLGIAAILAIPLGIVVGSSKITYQAARVLIEFLRPVPSVALIPLAVIVYGIGLESKVFLAAFASFWQLFMHTLYGVQDVDPVSTETARSFGVSRVRRYVFVTLPSSSPYIATGLRIASAVSLTLAVTAELVIGSSGLGQQIQAARSGGNIDLMYALTLSIGLLGWILNALFVRLEHWVLHWHPMHRPIAEAIPA